MLCTLDLKDVVHNMEIMPQGDATIHGEHVEDNGFLKSKGGNSGVRLLVSTNSLSKVAPLTLFLCTLVDWNTFQEAINEFMLKCLDAIFRLIFPLYK